MPMMLLLESCLAQSQALSWGPLGYDFGHDFFHCSHAGIHFVTTRPRTVSVCSIISEGSVVFFHCADNVTVLFKCINDSLQYGFIYARPKTLLYTVQNMEKVTSLLCIYNK